MREHQGIKRIDFTPDRHIERSVFKEAYVTAEFACVMPDGLGLLYASPEQLRVMGTLYNAMASRMEYLQLAAVAAKPKDDGEQPEAALA